MKRFILYRFYQSTASSFAETVQENMSFKWNNFLFYENCNYRTERIKVRKWKRPPSSIFTYRCLLALTTRVRLHRTTSAAFVHVCSRCKHLICWKSRKAVSFTSCCIGSATKRIMAALFIILEQPVEVPENACSSFINMICYRQSRNILLNRIGHGAFGYSLRFSHFYGEAILNYLLEFFFAWTPNYQHKGIPEW